MRNALTYEELFYLGFKFCLCYRNSMRHPVEVDLLKHWQIRTTSNGAAIFLAGYQKFSIVPFLLVLNRGKKTHQNL